MSLMLALLIHQVFLRVENSHPRLLSYPKIQAVLLRDIHYHLLEFLRPQNFLLLVGTMLFVHPHIHYLNSLAPSSFDKTLAILIFFFFFMFFFFFIHVVYLVTIIFLNIFKYCM